MGPSRLQPALLGGVAIGFLTALPFINVVNFCCCAWVVFGGALAAYLMQQNHPAPITAGDGAIVGLMAGAIGALVSAAIIIPVSLAMGPVQLGFIDWFLLENSGDVPPEVRAVFEQMRETILTGPMLGAGFVFLVLVNLLGYSVFGLLGGSLGAVLFRKNTPPPPPPASGFEPPNFTPPPAPPPLPGGSL